MSKVLPIYKSDDKTNFTNYRPISILPCFSKFLENIMYHRLMSNLIKYDILNSLRYGFRSKHSTFMAILELTNHIFEASERNSLIIGVFIDLKKAFDTVNNSILLDKLNFYGIRGIGSLSLFQDNLNSRCQFELANCRSSLQTIKCGVPQGSVLRSLLCLIHIIDIFASSILFSFILFVDDTTLFLGHNNISQLFSIVNCELSIVATWLKANKLTLHLDKTKFITFHPSRKKINSSNLTTCIDNSTIQRSEHTKFLGVIIHQNLLWQPHIKVVLSKITKSIGIIIKLRQFLLSNTLCTLYNSLILPYLQYCSIIWASTYSADEHYCVM